MDSCRDVSEVSSLQCSLLLDCGRVLCECSSCTSVQSELTSFESLVGVAGTALPELKGTGSVQMVVTHNSAVGRGNPW